MRKEEEERRRKKRRSGGERERQWVLVVLRMLMLASDVEPERLEPVSHKRNEVSLIISADYFVLRQIYLILHGPHSPVLSGVAFKYKCL